MALNMWASFVGHYWGRPRRSYIADCFTRRVVVALVGAVAVEFSWVLALVLKRSTALARLPYVRVVGELVLGLNCRKTCDACHIHTTWPKCPRMLGVRALLQEAVKGDKTVVVCPRHRRGHCCLLDIGQSGGMQTTIGDSPPAPRVVCCRVFNPPTVVPSQVQVKNAEKIGSAHLQSRGTKADLSSVWQVFAVPKCAGGTFHTEAKSTFFSTTRPVQGTRGLGVDYVTATQRPGRGVYTQRTTSHKDA